MVVDLRNLLTGAVILAPMTRGCNLPYRRLCDELGASITMGEMALARRLHQGRRQELALVRRAPQEKVFGIQLAGREPAEMAWATALAVERGADLVDVNLGCPIDEMTRRGLGAALLRKPARVRLIVEAMKRAAGEVPVTVKLRLGWTEGKLVHVKVAQAAVEGGADAVVVHARTRQARYRRPASWEHIAEVVEALDVPVVGNGDILFPHEIDELRGRTGCAGVMVGRGALIKPWIFREALEGHRDPGPDERLGIYRRYAELARDHWGQDEHGALRVRDFLLWHLDFWTRHVPRLPDGSFPKLQERPANHVPEAGLEAMLARQDAAARAWLADLILDGPEAAGEPPPAPPEAEPRRAPVPVAQG